MKGAASEAAREGFERSEFFETLLRIQRDEPRRYEREVSAGTRRRVELYEDRKRQAAAVSVRAA